MKIFQKYLFLIQRKIGIFRKKINGEKVSKSLSNRRGKEVEIFNKGDYVRTR